MAIVTLEGLRSGGGVDLAGSSQHPEVLEVDGDPLALQPLDGAVGDQRAQRPFTGPSSGLPFGSAIPYSSPVSITPTKGP